MTVSEEEIKEALKLFSPEERQFAENFAQLRIENQMLRHSGQVLRKEYDQLYKVLIVILDAQVDKELRIHKTQFLRFSEEYRIDRRYDQATKEMVFKLLTLREPYPDDKDGG